MKNAVFFSSYGAIYFGPHPFFTCILGGKEKYPRKTKNFIEFLETSPEINKKGVFTLKFVILMGTF